MLFSSWCDTMDVLVNKHKLRILSGREADIANAKASIAAIIPEHYASQDHIARALERLGKNKAAEFVRQKLPQNKSIRSGDLGEILATEYIARNTSYAVPVKRLRWKDHRNMAMRGDDVIGIEKNLENDRLHFLKCEAKSRVNLAAAVLTEAREALDKDDGLPSAHSLSFISERLLEAGDCDIADAIDDAQLKHGITGNDVEHLLFTFSGNDPKNLLKASFQGYDGEIRQNGVGLRVTSHPQFVSDVYEKVMANGDEN